MTAWELLAGALAIGLLALIVEAIFANRKGPPDER